MSQMSRQERAWGSHGSDGVPAAIPCTRRLTDCPVILLSKDPSARRSVSASLRYLRRLGVLLDLEPLASRSAFFSRLESAPHAVPVFDPFVPGFTIPGDVRRVIHTCTSSRPLVVADFSSVPVGRVIPQLVSSGVDRIISVGIDDNPDAIARNILECSGLAAVAFEIEKLVEAVPPEVRMMILWAVRNGHRRLSVGQAAREMGLSARSMSRWLARACDMTPAELLRWSRVLHASRVAAASDASLTHVAKMLSFSSVGALTRQFKLVVGKSPSSISREDLLETVRHRLVEALQSARPVDEEPLSRA